jgi:hypothetical protein
VWVDTAEHRAVLVLRSGNRYDVSPEAKPPASRTKEDRRPAETLESFVRPSQRLFESCGPERCRSFVAPGVVSNLVALSVDALNDLGMPGSGLTEQKERRFRLIP